MVPAHELHEVAVHAQHRAHVDLLLGEEGVALRQNEVRGGVDALGVARSEERADRASRMRGHVREETVLRGVRVLIQDIEDSSQVSVHEVEGVVAGLKLDLREDDRPLAALLS